MNKRIKKKHELVSQVIAIKGALVTIQGLLLCFLSDVIDLKDENRQLNKRIEELENLVTKNTQTTNQLFDEMKAENKSLRDEIEELKRKKSFFRR